ncbi:HNH endonuclease [Agromyces binzhouensis]|uniref:HNH endonuclease n=1 Tax=Agromyces binzhouensis TaxID=1817495 RepID=A0A4V1QTH1_9MICO|nr:HNH endonuclease [Agromyces binzhouensis]
MRRSTSYQRHRPAVLERDGYVCQICQLPTDPNAHPIDDTYPVLDHHSAVAWGGGDDIANLRTAHRWCNEWKADDLDVNPRIPEFAAVRLTPMLERAGLL